MFHNVFNSDTYRNALPICAAYLPLGLAYGIFAQAVGLNTIEIFFMSLFLFAITAQFIAISMIASGASLASIIVTVFLINSRHFLYSTTLVTHLKNHSKRFLSLFAQGVVDETFAVNLMKFTDGSWCTSRALGVNILVHTTWVLSSVIGSMLGEFVSIDVSVIGYMLTAMLICLWTYTLKDKTFIIAGIAGGLMAVLLVDFAATKANIIIAALAAATLGYWLNTRRVKKYVES
jgi:4-azaleucine resistance transporter AzlC